MTIARGTQITVHVIEPVEPEPEAYGVIPVRGTTVGMLRAALAQAPDDAVLVLSSDGEGNSFSPLADATVALYVAESSWSGDTYVLDSEIGRDGYTEEDRAPDEATPVIVLWPTN